MRSTFWKSASNARALYCFFSRKRSRPFGISQKVRSLFGDMERDLALWGCGGDRAVRSKNCQFSHGYAWIHPARSASYTAYSCLYSFSGLYCPFQRISLFFGWGLVSTLSNIAPLESSTWALTRTLGDHFGGGHKALLWAFIEELKATDIRIAFYQLDFTSVDSAIIKVIPITKSIATIISVGRGATEGCFLNYFVRCVATRL